MSTSKQPLLAQFIAVLAWLGLIGGALSLFAGISDSMNPHVPGGGSVELAGGVVLLLNSVIWFLGARAVTLLSQIEHNTRK